MDHLAETEARPVDDAAPVDALIQALLQQDADSVARCLAPQVRLGVPPLRIVETGAESVARALLDVVVAFDGLQYGLRSRYLTPGTLTDEAAISGTHTRDLLGAPPTGRQSTVSARIIAAHDGARVTRLDIWPDVAAVRGLCPELARHLDDQVQGAAGEMVAALRATIPVTDARVVRGSAREALGPATATTWSADPGDVIAPVQRSPGRTEGLKVPTPRRVRRRWALAAGALMLAASAAIITWVARGAMSSQGTGAVAVYPQVSSPAVSPTGTLDGTSTTATQSPTVSSPSASSASPSTSPAVTFANNQFQFSTDLLFETGSATLLPRAQSTLDTIIQRVLDENRDGVIVVSGYTDDVGAVAYNMRLSQSRADAVAAVLRVGLPGRHIISHGYGMADPVDTNSTKQGKANNRRVTVKVPPAGASAGTASPGSASSGSASSGSASPSPSVSVSAPRKTRTPSPSPSPSRSAAGSPSPTASLAPSGTVSPTGSPVT